MKSLLINDIKRRKILSFSEDKTKVLKNLKFNDKFALKWWSRHKLSSIQKKKINTRCIVTGRSRSINQTFKLSRLELCRWIKLNKVPGVSISSW